jgi:pimeloyl-ACP methyl ester carboxylesterase
MQPEMVFGRLARAMDGICTVSAIAVPGYDTTQPLAATVDVLLDVLVDATLRAARGEPFVLAGQSAGGMIAHCVAARLERDGRPAAGVVLLDTLIESHLDPRLSAALAHRFDGDERFRADRATYQAITASAAYSSLFSDWEPTPLDTPTLVVRPTEPVPAPPDRPPLTREEWRHHWPLPHTEIETQGHHMSIVVEQAATTAKHVLDWCETVVDAAAPGVAGEHSP